MLFGYNGSQRSQDKSGVWPRNHVHSHYIKGHLASIALGDGGWG